MSQIRWVIVSLLLLVACSNPSPTEDSPPPPSSPPSELPKDTLRPPPAPLTDTPSPQGDAILSDLMKKVRDTIGPLLRGGEDAQEANAQMEDLFLKIQKSVPEDWDQEKQARWISITEEALQGAPDARGLKPWSASCKTCHDLFREEYKERYHTRIIPVIP